MSGGWLGEKAATKVKRASPAKADLFDYSALDLSKIEIKSAVPLPPVRGAGKFRWDPLLDKMKVGQHVELPRKTRATIQAEIKQRKDKGLGEFSIRILSGEKLGLWRVK